MLVQWSSNAEYKGVFLRFVLCGPVYKQMTYSSVNQLQLLLCVQLQTGLEKLKRRGKGMKFESSCYGMWRHMIAIDQPFGGIPAQEGRSTVTPETFYMGTRRHIP